MSAKPRPGARSFIVWGATSGAGKSLLATALCRWAANRGIDVVPFKAQNMSNHARVVAAGDGSDDGEGAEIGSAQWLQALAARRTPCTDMNPVLLKPERDTASQVVLHGRVAPALAAMPWRERSVPLAAAARESFERLHARHELVVIEGAGSPAEINLAGSDYVNLATARWARDSGPAQALLVADIDRGGAFAHLYGTWRLLPDDLRPLLGGFVLNKFRGDAALLAPGPAQLQALTGVPLAGVLPMWRDHGLPDEDGLFDNGPAHGGIGHANGDGTALRLAVVATPRASKLDEFQPLHALPGVQLVWARRAGDLDGADWVVLPGSKSTIADLTWLRGAGFEPRLQRHAAAGRPLLGVCGGLQMLGKRLHDPDGVDGEPCAAAAGLGLLPLVTHYRAPKRLRVQPARFPPLAAPWQALDGVQVDGYEIRCGHTTQDADPASAPAAAALHARDGSVIGWQRGAVLGLTLHGVFENPAALQALFAAAVPTLDARLDALAGFAERHLGAATLERWLCGGTAVR
jgi:adenosylcobyric acid synthase